MFSNPRLVTCHHLNDVKSTHSCTSENHIVLQFSPLVVSLISTQFSNISPPKSLYFPSFPIISTPRLFPSFPPPPPLYYFPTLLSSKSLSSFHLFSPFPSNSPLDLPPLLPLPLIVRLTRFPPILLGGKGDIEGSGAADWSYHHREKIAGWIPPVHQDSEKSGNKNLDSYKLGSLLLSNSKDEVRVILTFKLHLGFCYFDTQNYLGFLLLLDSKLGFLSLLRFPMELIT